MSTRVPYERRGRVRQKARTRAALLDAARQLLAEGASPTVERAADRAQVSRTTAYRYFPNHRSLIAATYPDLDSPSLLGENPPSDATSRLELVMRRITEQLIAHEPELRAQLRLALEPKTNPKETLVLRQGRAITWIEDALAPLRDQLPLRELRTLVLAIRATTGIEAFVWLTDVGGAPPDEAVEIMRSSARTLLRSAIADSTTPRSASRRS
jgi:AcrR family transcriptional regulator